MDVGEWLRGLGLGQYETVFREHTIDMDVLAASSRWHVKSASGL